jgi:hypothetical protein
VEWPACCEVLADLQLRLTALAEDPEDAFRVFFFWCWPEDAFRVFLFGPLRARRSSLVLRSP